MSARGAKREGVAPRVAATRVVDQVLQQGRTLDHALANVLQDSLDNRDVSAVKALAYGALRWYPRHRMLIDALLDRPLRPRDGVLYALLSVALFELTHSARPAYAIVSATVAASRTLGRDRAAGMINAVLRRFIREREALEAQVDASPAGHWAHPAWFIERLRRDWPQQADSILRAGNEQPPLWLRVNTSRTTADAFQTLLSANGIESETTPGIPGAVRLGKPLPVEQIPGFEDGLFWVQDAAAQLAAPLVDAQPGMHVLDACAAPGGKAMHLLERCGGDLDLIALDLSADRLGRVAENAARLGFNLLCIAGDASDPAAWAKGRSFDRILIDAPCSATGVIRRHPDIKVLRRAGDIPPFAARQSAMLGALFELLRPGGRLIYATCSVLPEENDAVVSEFLVREPRARRLGLPGSAFPDTLQPTEGPGFQCLPGAGDTDGLYYALMTRQP